MATFKPGIVFLDGPAAAEMNMIAQLAKGGVMGVFGDLVLLRDPKGGVQIGTRPRPMSVRGCVVYGDVMADPFPHTFPLANVVSDVDETGDASAVLASVSSNEISFTAAGIYLVTYHCTGEVSLAGATDYLPGVGSLTTYLRASGTTVPGTTHLASCPLIPNFRGFVKTDNEALDISVNVGGATGLTAIFETEPVATCDGSTVDVGNATGIEDSGVVTLDNPQVLTVTNTCVEVISAATLDVSNQQAVTLDADQNLDATTNAAAIADYSTTGAASLSTSGTCILEVVNDAAHSGTLKIKIGATLYANALDLYGELSTFPNGNPTKASISIIRLA